MGMQRSIPDWLCECDPTSRSYEQCTMNMARCNPGAEEVRRRMNQWQANANRRRLASLARHDRAEENE